MLIFYEDWMIMEMKITKVGKGGTVTIPASIRRRIGIEDGAQVIAEETEEGVLIRPAVTVPVEVYTSERKAEFLLSNAVDRPSYQAAKKIVRQMGLDPDSVPHVECDGIMIRDGSCVS